MRRHLFLKLFFVYFTLIGGKAYGQNGFGIGPNIGYRAFGVHVNYGFLSRVNIECGVELQRYGRLGFFYGGWVYPITTEHRKWRPLIGLFYNNTMGGNINVKYLDKIYSYSITNIDYFLPTIGASVLDNDGESKSIVKSAIASFNISYAIRTTDFALQPLDGVNIETIENGLTKYFKQRSFGIYVSLVIYLGGKK
jgi:hypothetical protein